MIAGIRKEKLVWIEYGLQSAHARTLTRINRGHDPEAFFDAVHRTSSRGIPPVAHLILGLPGESVQDMVSTARAVSSAGVHGVKLHPLYVIRNTELENMMQRGLYAPLTEEDAIEMTVSVLQALSPEIVVHRLTSDPHGDELVAPLWMLDKRGVRARLEQALRSRDVRQGTTWDGICHAYSQL
jgi:radical SAM protein (TIGR01212 family)